MADNICLSVRHTGGLKLWGNTGRGSRGGGRRQHGPTDQEMGDSHNTAPPPILTNTQAVSNATALVEYFLSTMTTMYDN